MRFDTTRAHSTPSYRVFYGLLTAATTSALMMLGCSSDPTDTGEVAGSSSSSGAGSVGSGGEGGAGTGGTGGVGGTGGAGSTSSTGGIGGMGGMGGMGGGSAWDPEAGWTDFKESADTQKVYVSSSTGNDNNDGLSEGKAVKTIAKGKSIIRDKMPDRLLLKRGDVWSEGLGTWSKSGKSATEPLVVSTYGAAKARPLLKTGAKGGVYAGDKSTINYVAFIGIHLYANTRDPDSPDFVGAEGEEGVRWLSKTDGLLFEDMYVQFYKGPNFTIQGTVPNTNSIVNVKLRRNIITDSYSTDGHAQGIYSQQVTNLLIEENLFDHNGWNDKVKGAQKTIFNHNMYINATCNDLTVKNNISVRAASHGLQARPGGMVSGNLFVDDPIGFSYGLVLGSAPKEGGVTGEISDNIVLSSADIEPEDLPRGYGVHLGNIKSAVMENNIIAHDKSAKPYGIAVDFSNNGIGIHNFTMQDNIIYDWRGNVRFDSAASYLAVLVQNNEVQAPEDKTLLVQFSGGFPSGVTFKNNVWDSDNETAKWFLVGGKNLSLSQWTEAGHEKGGTSEAVMYMSPELKISDYHKSLGKAADFYAFLAEARKQMRGNYLQEYTTQAPMAFIRDGFKVKP